MNATSTSLPRWTYVCAALAVALSLVSLSYRYRVEQGNRAVAMAAEADIVEQLGASQGLSFEQSLRALKEEGFNAVVLSEETVGDLAGSGLLTIYPAGREGGYGFFARGVRIASGEATFDRFKRGLDIRYPIGAGIYHSMGYHVLSPALIRGISVGLNPDQAKVAMELGMTIIARCNNSVGVNSAAVEGTLDWAHELGATIFLPMGDQVLGRRDSVEPFIEKMRSLGMLYASPEFAKIGGDANILEKAPDIVIRLQAAQSAEVDKMTQAETAERYILAGSERDVRVLLVRPLSFSGEAPLDSFADLGKAIGTQLEREGGVLKQPRPFPEPGVPAPLFVLIAVAIALTAAGVLSTFCGTQAVRIGATAVFLLVAFASFDPRFRPFAALLGAITFPVLAFLILGNGVTKNVVAEFLILSAVSVCGGLCVAGMLNAAPYFIRADQFFGVKAAQFAPIAIVGSFYFTRLCETRGIGKNPVLWGQVLLGVAILVAMGIMWMRSGNDNPAAVSGVELKLRSLLTRYLAVRPRTKEIFIGHPLMIVGIAMLLRARLAGIPKPKNGGWIALAVTGGAVGQTSIVNTMCHLHTPLTVGLIRILVGLVLGGILGLVLWAILKRLVPEREG
jgi:hypothetical protein